MTVYAAQAPIVKTVTVMCPVDRAFDLFTRKMTEWWPLLTHSVGGAEALRVEMHCAQGGQIVEHLADGTREVWGTINEWTPPHRLTFSWHPGTPEAEATSVEVRFRAQGATTEVTLVHSGWEQRPDGRLARDAYTTGWALVLRNFTLAARDGEHVAASDRG